MQMNGRFWSVSSDRRLNRTKICKATLGSPVRVEYLLLQSSQKRLSLNLEAIISNGGGGEQSTSGGSNR